MSKKRLGITMLHDFVKAGKLRIQAKARNIQVGQADGLPILVLYDGK